ncbi:MAG: hypothetical protein C0602_06355 [Denitrovibrio sp.]|nr:MAG: hypothetical protein C0602_06355 [Denitrovibrio sp.]
MPLDSKDSKNEIQKKRGIFHNIPKNWKHVRGKIYLFLTVSVLVLLVVFAYFFNSIFINIYPGEAGVLWKRFSGGTEMDYVYNEGLQIIFPWDKMYKYDIRVQQYSYDFEALSKDGLIIKFDLSVRFFPQRLNLPKLHKEIGPDYIEKVVKPEVQAHLRKVVANYTPEEIYTSEGYLLQIIIQGSMGAFSDRYLNLENLLVKKMTLPASIRDAIERKLTQEQKVKEYDYRLMREAKEAQRKSIEAEGIKRFQEIVKSGKFFDKYIQYKGIDATLELSKSNNSKVVVVGSNGNLPLIMNLDSAGKAPDMPAEAAKIAPQETTRDNKETSSPEQGSSVEDIVGETESASDFLSRIKGYFNPPEKMNKEPINKTPGN